MKKSPKRKKAPGYESGGPVTRQITSVDTPDDYLATPEKKKKFKDLTFKEKAEDIGRLSAHTGLGLMGLDSLVKKDYNSQFGVNANDKREKYVEPVANAAITTGLDVVAPGTGDLYNKGYTLAENATEQKERKRLDGETDLQYSERMAKLGIDVTDTEQGLQGYEGVLGEVMKYLAKNISKKAGGEEGFSKGGQVKGPGTAKSDSISAKVEKGSFVVPEENAGIADHLAAKFLGSKKKTANLNQKGGVDVKLSNGEHLFTPEEAAKLKSIGVDLNALAPNAENEYANGGPVGDDKKKAKKVAKAPEGYKQTLSEDGKTYYEKQMDIADAKSGTTKANSADYDKFLKQQLASGVKPEDLVKKGYLAKEKLDQYQSYYKPSADIVYTEKDVPVETKEQLMLKKRAKISGRLGDESLTNKNFLTYYSPDDTQGYAKAKTRYYDRETLDEISPEMFDKDGNYKPVFIGGNVSNVNTIRNASSEGTTVVSADDDLEDMKIDTRGVGVGSDGFAKGGKVESLEERRARLEANKSEIDKLKQEYIKRGGLNPAQAARMAENDWLKSNPANKSKSPAKNSETSKTTITKTKAPGKSKDPVIPESVRFKTPEINLEEGSDEVVVPEPKKKPVAQTEQEKNLVRTALDEQAKMRLNPSGDTTNNDKKKTPVFSAEDALAVGQIGLGVYNLFKDGKRPVDQIDPEFNQVVDQSKSEAGYGFDNATKTLYKKNIEQGRMSAVNLAAQNSGGNSASANAHARAATNDYADNLVKLSSADAQLRQDKKRYSDGLVTQKAAMKRNLFMDKMNAYDINQAAGAELLGAGIQNYFGNQWRKDGLEAESKINQTANVTPNIDTQIVDYLMGQLKKGTPTQTLTLD